MIADCALRQNRQQLRKLSFSKLLYSWLFHFPSEGDFRKRLSFAHCESMMKGRRSAFTLFWCWLRFPHEKRFRAPTSGEHRIKIQDRKRCGEKSFRDRAFLLLFNVLVGVARGWWRKILSQTPKKKFFLFSVLFHAHRHRLSEIIQMLEITSLDFIPVMNTSQLKLSRWYSTTILSFTED